MNFIINLIKDFPRYLMSGFSSLAAILLFIALWDFGNEMYGDLVLPSPKVTFLTLFEMLKDEMVINDIFITIKRALIGFGISVTLGSILGLLSGLYVTASILSRPIVTILLGMPPIAWIVLAMIWFGMTDDTVIFTVVVASLPIVFLGALQGTRTLEGDLKQMAESFNLTFKMKLFDLYFPHIFSYVFPAWISALGMSWKIVVMAELLSSNDGIGAALAISRSQLDTPTALSLVVIMIGSLLLIEYLFLEPLKREVELWRK